MKIAIAPNRSARLITTSISNSRYRRMETPIAIGIRPKDATVSACKIDIQPGAVVSQEPPHDRTRADAYRTPTAPAAVTSHRSCNRSIPVDRRNRWTRPIRDPITPIGSAAMNTRRPEERTAAPRSRADSSRREGALLNRPRIEEDRQDDDHEAGAEDPREPAPPGRRQMPVGEEQDEEGRGEPESAPSWMSIATHDAPRSRPPAPPWSAYLA